MGLLMELLIGLLMDFLLYASGRDTFCASIRIVALLS